MHSPIRKLDKDVINSLVRISPENRQALEQFKIRFDPQAIFTDNKGFTFQVNTNTKEIKIPTNALEYLWCSAYTFYLIYIKYSSEQNVGSSNIFNLQNDEELSIALEMYKWSHDSLSSHKKTPWKNHYPSPQELSTKNPDSPENIATELFLCAIAWILHHEIAHIYHEHPNEMIYNNEVRDQEKEADASATKWILGSTKDPKMLQKRGLGVIIAILAITARDIFSKNFNSSTHPKSFERLLDAIEPYFEDENHIVYAFSAIIIQVHMIISGITPKMQDNPSWKEDLIDYIITLSRI